MKKKDRFYVSEFDQKMAEFNRSHPESAAQRFEKQKYAEIYSKRDHASTAATDEQDNSLWD